MNSKLIRVGWDEAFKRMAQEGDDILNDFFEFDIVSDWDDNDWTW